MVSRSFALGLAFAACVGGLGLACSAVTSAEAFNDGTTLGGGAGADAGAEGSDSPQARPSADAGAPNLGLESGILLVNATRGHPAFRICPPNANDAMFSKSQQAPLPTTLMPRSNLAGVDINGAAAIDPQADFAGLDHVLVLRVDDDTKDDLLADVSCAKVACIQSGCLGEQKDTGRPPKMTRVPLVDVRSNPVRGALALPGRLVVLRDDLGKGLRFEVVPIEVQALVGPKRMLVDYRNFSDHDGAVSYEGADGSTIPILSERPTPVDVGVDYAKERFLNDLHTASLSEIHLASDPRVPIESFYRSPGSFALLLVGTKAVGKTDERYLRFLAVPVTAPKRVQPIGDGGSTDGSRD